MKKVLVATALVATLAIIGIQQAGAYGPGECWQNRGGAPGQTLDKETLKKYEAFRTETAEIRKEMTIKRAQMQALMQGDNPDADRAGELASTLFDLRTQIQAKADDAGLQGFGPGYGRDCNGPGDCYRGRGGGQGYGRGCDGPGNCNQGRRGLR